MDPRIIGISGPLQGQTLSLSEGEVSIGRASNNQVCVIDGALSRQHCLLIRTATEIRIKDLNSRNGTRVNGIPITEQPLQHGDQISLGSSLLVFRQEPLAVRGRSNPVFLEDTASLSGIAVLLPQEESPFLPLEAENLSVLTTGRAKGDLNALLKISTAIGSIRDRDSLQWQLLGFIFDVIPAERASVLFLDSQGAVTSTTAWDRVHGPETVVPVSQTVVKKVVRERAGLLVTTGVNDSILQQTNAAKGGYPASLLCVPMIIDKRVIGVIYLDAKLPVVQFDEAHLRVLQAIAHIAALASENLEHWEKLRQENMNLRAEIALTHDIVGKSPKIQKVFDFIRKVAPSDSTVLIQGESGTGKELVARAIHSNSSRAEGPFVAINSAAIPANLLESELFGHEKGAFTGAVSQKKGKIEQANGGSLFLDEISELAPELQAKLLRVLQEREFERVGATKLTPLNVRLIAATNKLLSQAVEAGEFRKDLFYRLNVVAVTVPPLRERREDIPGMAEYFLIKNSARSKTLAKSISAEALQCLTNYDWPGNVRELENAIERAAVMGTTEAVRPEDLPEGIVEGTDIPGESPKYYAALKDFKKQIIEQALQQANGSYTEAAKTLGLHPNSLLRLIRNLNIKSKSSSSTPTSD
jgi:transcriptional regulator with GAF, ATPase, and Fis domain